MKAFPTPSNQIEQGMDLRDYFAARAMKEIVWEGGKDSLMQSARDCYRIADAMMEARKK
jgi:hypothetical protein